MYRIINGLLIESNYTSINLRSNPDLVGVTQRMDDNTRTLYIEYQPNITASEFSSFTNITVINPAEVIILEGSFNMHNDKVIVNGIRYYRMKGTEELWVTTIIEEDKYGNTIIKKVGNVVEIHIKESDVTSSDIFTTLEQLSKNLGHIYIVREDVNNARISAFDYINMNSVKNITISNQTPLVRTGRHVLDEVKVISNFIKGLRERFPQETFIPFDDDIPEKPTTYFIYKTTLDNPSENYHLYSHELHGRIYYCTIEVRFTYNTIDLQKLIHFRRSFLMNKQLSSYTNGKVVFTNNNDSSRTRNISFGIHWAIDISAEFDQADSAVQAGSYAISGIVAKITSPVIIQ